MLWNAKNGCVSIGDTQMHYVSFGGGNEPLVMIPGLGDGLTTVKGMALPLAWTYRLFAPQYTVYIFSRKNDFPESYSTREMARDQAEAMERLGIGSANVLGVSQGGMIAQYLAIDHPQLVKKLVLAVTAAKPNASVKTVISRWILLAEQGKHRELMMDTAEHSYSEDYLKKYRRFYPLLGLVGKPKDYGRFLRQAVACLTHDAWDELERIQCPTLVIGGAGDKIVGVEASREMAEKICDCKAHIYGSYGHAAYEEAADFNQRVMDFFAE